jgi:hypothetical protein
MKLIGYTLLFILFLILRYLYVITKEEKNEPAENNDNNRKPDENSNHSENIEETNYLSKQIIDFLNKAKFPYLVSDGGNMIQIEYPFEEFNSRIDIYTNNNNHHHVLYRILIIDEFPDNRLYKMLELMARLNIKFYEGNFNMFIEQRVVVFDSYLTTSFNVISEELHIGKLQLLVYILENFRKSFMKVAHENEEPIVALPSV